MNSDSRRVLNWCQLLAIKLIIGVSVSEPPSSDADGTFFYIIYIYIVII